MGELCFKMVISDPPICFDLSSVGQEVKYNQYKFDSVDGFVKADESCFIILPSVHKQVINTSTSATFTAGGQPGSLGEVLIKANVLPLSYEFP